MRSPQAERQVHGQDKHDEQDHPEFVSWDIGEGPTPHRSLELSDKHPVINSSREEEDSSPRTEEELGEHEGREDGKREVGKRLPPFTQFEWRGHTYGLTDVNEGSSITTPTPVSDAENPASDD
ncbi:hypothetical protein ES703_02701 [subsurface metagenome]